MNAVGILISGTLLVGIAALGYRMIAPADTMDHSMSPPDTSAVEDGAPIAQVRVPASFTANAQIGNRIFDAKCSVCHGTNAAGQNGVAPPLVHKIYEPSHHGDMAFVLAAKNGVRAHHWKFGNMPRIEGITDGEVKLVTTYIRELQRENGIN